MKAISLWQPWASAMALGWKKNETRHWATKYRGPLLIHAAKKIVAWPSIYVQYLFEKTAFIPSDLPLGMVLCKVDLIDCIKITYPDSVEIESREFELGNYNTGRYMWITENLETFEPFPAKGRQRFFEVDYE